jgi:hypothetical protein
MDADSSVQWHVCVGGGERTLGSCDDSIMNGDETTGCRGPCHERGRRHRRQ